MNEPRARADAEMLNLLVNTEREDVAGLGRPILAGENLVQPGKQRFAVDPPRIPDDVRLDGLGFRPPEVAGWPTG